MFPPLSYASDYGGDSCTNFKIDLLQYVRAYNIRGLDEWIDIIRRHDMSQAKYDVTTKRLEVIPFLVLVHIRCIGIDLVFCFRVHIIASIPGRHTASTKHHFGHMKLRKVL